MKQENLDKVLAIMRRARLKRQERAKADQADYDWHVGVLEEALNAKKTNAVGAGFNRKGFCE